GKVLWRSKDLKDKASYSSLRVLEVGGVRQYVVLTYVDGVIGSFVAGVAANDGRLLWRVPLNKGASYALVPTPIIDGDLVYVTAGYGAGCRLLQIEAEGKNKLRATELYKARTYRVMKNTHGGVVHLGEHIYGHCEKFGWVCQNMRTGASAWTER